MFIVWLKRKLKHCCILVCYGFYAENLTIILEYYNIGIQVMVGVLGDVKIYKYICI